MVAAVQDRPLRHMRALATSSALAGYYREMYRPAMTMINPKKVIRLLKEAEVSFVLMGTHGLGGWRSQPRATQDVDILVARKDHNKAVRVLREAFPKLLVEDGVIVTRFKDPLTGEPRIDLMKPLQDVYRIAFRHCHWVADSHRIPTLEMALVSKFAAMVSPQREKSKKLIDAGDFADMLEHNRLDLDLLKLERLAEQVYKGGAQEIAKLVEDILAGRPIVI